MVIPQITDRFSCLLTGSYGAVAPGGATTLAVSNATGLDAGGNQWLTIVRPQGGGLSPQFVDVITAWVAIGAGPTLTTATRVGGAALQAGDIVLSAWDHNMRDGIASAFAALATGFDAVIPASGVMAISGSTAYSGKRIWLQGGTVTMTGHWQFPTGADIVCGGAGTGPLTFDRGVNDYQVTLQGANGNSTYTTQYDYAGSFAAVTGPVTLNGGATYPADMAANPANWKLLMQGTMYDVASVNGPLTQATLTSGVSAILNKPISGSVITVIHLPSVNVTIHGRIHLTGTGNYNAALLVGSRFDFRDCKITFDAPPIEGLASSIFGVFMWLHNSGLGHVEQLPAYRLRTAAAGAGVYTAISAWRCLNCQAAGPFVVHDFAVENTMGVARDLQIIATSINSSVSCSFNIQVNQLAGLGASGTRSIYGMDRTSAINCVSIGAIKARYAAAAWSSGAFLGATGTDSYDTTMRVA